MGKIVVSENVSLDGVIQDPAGVEGFRLGGWVGILQKNVILKCVRPAIWRMSAASRPLNRR